VSEHHLFKEVSIIFDALKSFKIPTTFEKLVTSYSVAILAYMYMYIAMYNYLLYLTVKNYPKITQNVISVELNIKIFLGGMPPDPLALSAHCS